MNIGKSIRMALIKRNKDIKWLAEMLACSESNADRMRYAPHQNASSIVKLSAVFNMKCSKFIELGE